MLFIALAKFRKQLSKDVVAQNMKDIETDTKGQIQYKGIWWTLGRYDTVVMFEARCLLVLNLLTKVSDFEAPDEKAAMNLVLKRADRMAIEMLVAMPADASSPAGPV